MDIVSLDARGIGGAVKDEMPFDQETDQVHRDSQRIDQRNGRFVVPCRWICVEGLLIICMSAIAGIAIMPGMSLIVVSRGWRGRLGIFAGERELLGPSQTKWAAKSMLGPLRSRACL